MITELIKKLKPFLMDSDIKVAEKAGKAIHRLQAKAFFERMLGEFPKLSEEKKTKLINELKAVSPKNYLEYINLGLSDENKYVRALTVKQIIEFNDPRMIEKVLPLINDSESIVRKIAYEFLGLFGIEKLAPILNKKLEQENDPDALLSLIDAIGSIGHLDSLDFLIAMLQKETRAGVRGKLVEAIGKLKVGL
ncbi:MAG: HEAT repeat domain-containing protein [Proteobacteria bacterium]|nr:HEAT repeat domain-containing protein [Pseudomonadota bacterium]